MSISTVSSVSGASLARRSRTRTRSRTVSASPSADHTSFPPPSPTHFVAEPLDMYPAAFSRPFELGHERESIVTHGSSSVYPPSTSASTVSGTESPPSPRSLAEQIDHNQVSSFDPELEHEYDGDDVSYRLRLLVKNNYFLPPAHAKPSPSDLAATDSLKRAAKPPPTPTIFDFFRRARSKSRSKPSTPTGVPHQVFDLTTPALRTTSEPAAVSPQETRGRTLTQTPRQQDAAPGRVVVVRERMSDIATAVKQAEQEMKARAATSRDPSHPSIVDVIDPTDAVDVPPPSAAYPFAVQASALHEMGVDESVGAALLADRLPPPHSPHGDGNWRKDLLRAAVDYSLNNSTDVLVSPRPKSRSSPTSTESSAQRSIPPRPPKSPNRPPLPAVQIGQRIVSPPLDEGMSSARSIHSEESRADEEVSRVSSTVPVRVETPTMPLTPLAPPPRKLVNPLYSISQTSLPLEVAPATDHQSESRLSNTYDRHAMLSPPLIRPDYPRASSDSDALSFYSDDAHEIDRRPSMASSSRERPSISLSAQPSPTRSAFRDALDQPPVARPPRSSSLRGSLDHPTCPSPSPIPRDSMASPPPRVSSSLAHFTPLLPPPRAAPRPRLPPIGIFPEEQETLEILAPPPSTPPLPQEQIQILAPPPSTPPFGPEINTFSPSSPAFSPSGRGGVSLSLAIPRQFSDSGPRSAPPVTSFFDSIQNQPNAMDDLDSSSDEETDEDGDGELDISPPQTPIFVNPRTRALSNVPPPSSISNSSSRSLLMRLGNHSTPYVSRSSDEGRKPVSNVPKSNTFFTQRRGGRSDQGHGPPTSTFDFYQYAKQKAPSPTTVAGPSRRSETHDRPTNTRELESLRRLDGMLIQHMEAERASIRRIATNLSTTNGKRLR
ncbi:hypothetical protein MIND_00245100 [Mycena indigotica]|uniref:Uncharacterized protein n=1 Tax=Mycena indigotica TaxID=2126181 RepID=A0A8H6T589_9AGAR|nr:uncharacterized protein MIND_00245100 [Mycena indigotica]KAF7312320.1 hypothetical protein MIND_00245100 [Mycena indigotica]